MKSRPITIMLLALLTACASYYPPTRGVALAPRAATLVNETFDRTWQETVTDIAQRNIPIATIDKDSGLITSERISLLSADAAWADCGREGDYLLPADYARFNVVVRDIAPGQSSVQITASFDSDHGPPLYGVVRCISRGVWESDAEAAIRQAAEGGVGP